MYIVPRLYGALYAVGPGPSHVGTVIKYMHASVSGPPTGKTVAIFKLSTSNLFENYRIIIYTNDYSHLFITK